MKKLAFLFAAVVAVSFASCGNKTAENTSAVDSDSIVTENCCVEESDSCCARDSCCADSDSCCADTNEAPVAE